MTLHVLKAFRAAFSCSPNWPGAPADFSRLPLEELQKNINSICTTDPPPPICWAHQVRSYLDPVFYKNVTCINMTLSSRVQRTLQENHQPVRHQPAAALLSGLELGGALGHHQRPPQLLPSGPHGKSNYERCTSLQLQPFKASRFQSNHMNLMMKPFWRDQRLLLWRCMCVIFRGLKVMKINTPYWWKMVKFQNKAWIKRNL